MAESVRLSCPLALFNTRKQQGFSLQSQEYAMNHTSVILLSVV